MKAASALLALAVSGCAQEAETMASLETASEHGTYRFEVGSFEDGYPLHIQCTEKCPRPVNMAMTGGDHPLGLFSRDQDDLVFYLASGGSAYRVRVWQLSDSGIRQVAELSTRGRPDFLSDGNGHAVIQTYEGDSGVGPWQRVRWTYRNGAFERTSSEPNDARSSPFRRSRNGEVAPAAGR